MALVGEESVGANFAVELVCYDNLLWPSELNRTSLGHGVDRSEVDRVCSNVCNLVRFLIQLKFFDLCSKLIHNSGCILRVRCNLVKVSIGDNDVLEARRRFGTDRVSNIFDTPLECTCKVLHLFKFDFH